MGIPPARRILKITPPTNNPWISALHEVSRFRGSVLSVAFCYLELKERKGAATILTTPAAPHFPDIFASRRNLKYRLRALQRQIHTRTVSLADRPVIAAFR